MSSSYRPDDFDKKQKIILCGRSADLQTIPATNNAPPPRVGAATATLNYIFSGRGGKARASINEKGHLWVLNPSTGSWDSLPPSSITYPEARSYHCMTSDDSDAIYVHAGCPEEGEAVRPVGLLNLQIEWRQLTSAPGPPRGGSSMAFVDGRLYRMNGFDGKVEQGGSVDMYDPIMNTWDSYNFAADRQSGPSARSVSALISILRNHGTSLVTLFGESDPSSLGHHGAGRMLSDRRIYLLSDKRWSRITSESQHAPEARGWFGADAVIVDDKDSVVIVGGSGESNDRLDDAWLLPRGRRSSWILRAFSTRE